MAAVHEYPLIAVTEVFDMPSVDNPDYLGELGPTEEILAEKLSAVLDYYRWRPDMEFDNPIHIVEYGPGEESYGHSLGRKYYGKKLMGNGHHRLAYQALVQGALFVPYCNTKRGSGW